MICSLSLENMSVSSASVTSHSGSSVMPGDRDLTAVLARHKPVQRRPYDHWTDVWVTGSRWAAAARADLSLTELPPPPPP